MVRTETMSSRVGERALREIYPPPFEAAVREGGAGDSTVGWRPAHRRSEGGTVEAGRERFLATAQGVGLRPTATMYGWSASMSKPRQSGFSSFFCAWNER